MLSNNDAIALTQALLSTLAYRAELVIRCILPFYCFLALLASSFSGILQSPAEVLSVIFSLRKRHSTCAARAAASLAAFARSAARAASSDLRLRAIHAARSSTSSSAAPNVFTPRSFSASSRRSRCLYRFVCAWVSSWQKLAVREC